MQITQEVVKNGVKIDKNVEKESKNDKTEGKTMEKTQDFIPGDLERQAAELKKSGKMKKLVASIKGKGKKDKAVNHKTEEVTMEMPKWRSEAEQILIDVCKKNGFSAPQRIGARENHKTGIGALWGRSKEGHVKVSVSANQLILHAPPKAVGLEDHWKQSEKYAWVTMLTKMPAKELPKIFLKALKDPHPTKYWQDAVGFERKASTGSKVDLAAQKAALEAKLSAVNKRLKEEVKSATPKKTKTKKAKVVNPAIAAVAAEIK